MKVDFYQFEVFNPYRFGGVRYKTLQQAKSAYMAHLGKGDRVGSGIYGCTKADDSIFLTYTPWFVDVRAFGRTLLTNIGELVRQGRYS